MSVSKIFLWRWNSYWEMLGISWESVTILFRIKTDHVLIVLHLLLFAELTYLLTFTFLGLVESQWFFFFFLNHGKKFISTWLFLKGIQCLRREAGLKALENEPLYPQEEVQQVCKFPCTALPAPPYLGETNPKEGKDVHQLSVPFLAYSLTIPTWMAIYTIYKQRIKTKILFGMIQPTFAHNITDK